MDLDMQVTPALFDYKGHKLLATSSKECRIFLLDRDNLGGADHRTPLVRTTWMCNEEVNFAAAGVWGSLASWEDAKGTRWVLSPIWGPSHPDFKVPVTYGPVTHGAIVAWKVEEKNGKIVMTPAWMSRDMDQAEPPVVANGVVYAYGNGESSVQATPEMGLGANQSSIRIKNSTHAVFYALDARDRQGAVELGRRNQIVRPLHGPFHRQRARLPGHVRQHAVLVRSSGTLAGRRIT